MEAKLSNSIVVDELPSTLQTDLKLVVMSIHNGS